MLDKKSTSRQDFDPFMQLCSYVCKEAEGKKCKGTFIRMVNAAHWMTWYDFVLLQPSVFLALTLHLM